MLSVTFGILAVLCLAYFGVIAVYSGIQTSMIWIWLVLAFFFFLLSRGLVFYHQHRRMVPLWIPVSVTTLLITGLVIFAILQVLIFGGIARREPAYLDYLIVLGARVREDDISLSLKARLDRAIRFLEEHPETTLVLSGGQGEDEPTTEAMAMAEYLRYNGVEPERMLLETNSTNTTENMICSYALIQDQRRKEKEEARARRNQIRKRRMELDRFLMETEALYGSAKEDDLAGADSGYGQGRFQDGNFSQGGNLSQGGNFSQRRSSVPVGPVLSVGPGSREPIRIPPSPKETEFVPDKPLQIGVLTSNYHLYRAMQIGKKNGFSSLSGVAASSDPVLFVHFCVRESMAILKDKFMGNM